MTVTDPVEVTTTVLVEVPEEVPAGAGAEAGAGGGAEPPGVVPLPVTVTLTLLSKLQGEMSVTPGTFPPTNLPPNWTEGPGFG